VFGEGQRCAWAAVPDVSFQFLTASLIVSYMLENGSVIAKSYTIGAQSRISIDTIGAVGVGQRFSIQTVSTVPVVIYRMMFSGTDVAGIIGSPTTDLNWYLAEGFTAFGYETSGHGYPLSALPLLSSTNLDFPGRNV
jgi:hypothetical protein